MVPVALGAVVVLLFFQPMFWLVFTFGWMVFPAFGLLASGLTGLASTPSGKQLERDSTAAKERELLGVLKDRGELTPAPAAAILLPAAFFLSVLSPDATEPNSFIYLAYLGAVSLATGLLVLGIGLMRKPRALQER